MIGEEMQLRIENWLIKKIIRPSIKFVLSEKEDSETPLDLNSLFLFKITTKAFLKNKFKTHASVDRTFQISEEDDKYLYSKYCCERMQEMIDHRPIGFENYIINNKGIFMFPNKNYVPGNEVLGMILNFCPFCGNRLK